MTADSEATTYNLADLVELAWSGQVRVPHFQRDFRWARDDIAKLFDSIIKGYPVGSLLLWIRPARAEKIRLGAMSIDAAEMTDALWVVDGQQRITSLANSLHDEASRDSRFALAYDLRHSELVTRADDPAVIPLPVLFDLQKLLLWFRDHPEIDARIDDASRVTKALREYKMPAYRVTQTDVAVLEEIFDRLNNSGKRLRRNEVFSALYAGAEDRPPDYLTIPLISEDLEVETRFGPIEGNTVLQALLARRGPDVTREIRNEFSGAVRDGVVEFPSESEQDAYAGAKEALRLAIGFLQKDAAVPHVSMLPYSYLLVVLARFFAHYPNPDTRVRLLLRRWFWRAAVIGPGIFPAGTTGAARTMNRAIISDDVNASVRGLLDSAPRGRESLPDLLNFRTNRASTKMVIASWWSLGPMSPKDGRSYELTDLSLALAGRSTAKQAVYPIVDPRSVSPELRSWAAAWFLLPDDDVQAGELDELLARPGQLGDTVWENMLVSHGLTPDLAVVLARGDGDEFVRRRHEAMRAHVERFVEIMCEWEFEDTPSLDSLVLEDLESGDDD